MTLEDAISGKVIKLHLKGTPHVTVVHKKKDWCHVSHVPVTSLPPQVRKFAAKLPTSTSRTFRIKAGDQGAEAVFSAVKRHVARLNMQSSATWATINGLAAAWLQKNVGFQAEVDAMLFYQKAIFGNTDPAKAYKDISWLTEMEPIS